MCHRRKLNDFFKISPKPSPKTQIEIYKAIQTKKDEIKDLLKKLDQTQSMTKSMLESFEKKYN